MARVTHRRLFPVSRKNSGSTLIEFLICLAIILVASAYVVRPQIFGRGGDIDKSLELFQQQVGEKRGSALAGIEDPSERTLDVTNLQKSLPLGVSVVSDAAAIPPLPLDAPLVSSIEFSPQSGVAPRTVTLGLPGKKKPVGGWGWIVLKSLRDRDTVAVLVPYQPGPVLMYRRDNSPGAKSPWVLMQSRLY